MIRRSASPSPRGPHQQGEAADVLGQKCHPPQPSNCDELGVPHGGVISRMEAHIAAILSSVATSSSPPKALRQVFLHTLILSEIHCLVLQQGTCTQRDLYYHLCRKVSSQKEVNAAVQQLCSVLNVPRKLLGVQAGFRGSIGGALSLNGIDLRNIGQQGLLIPGALAELQEVGQSQGDAASSSTTFAPHIECHPCLRFLLIVEKDAVFQKLMAERIFDVLPCVVLSGHGFPSLAARAMAHYIVSVAPHLIVLGLADYNPSGVHILLQFKEGRGSPQYALPALKWLGVHSTDLSAESSLKPFSHRCKAQLRNLLAVPHAPSKIAGTPVEWIPEIHRMKDGSVSAEIESLYGTDGTFSQFVASKALRQQYF